MSAISRAPAATKLAGNQSASNEKSLFEQQRDAIVGEIAVSLEHVLQNLNRLNRNLESITAVGNEFSSVEALWSQFEGVMAKVPDEDMDKDERQPGENEEDNPANNEQNATGENTTSEERTPMASTPRK